MNETRPRGVILRVLDTDRIARVASEQLDHPVKLAYAPYAFVEHNGDAYVVCDEGVGWKVTDSEPLEVGLYSDQPGFMAIAPMGMARLSLDEVRQHVTSQKIDLADLIRTYNARLADNFRAWHRRLTA